MIDQIDERTRRRPDFGAGEPIVLADGQAWHFPRPVVSLFPIVGPDGRLADLGGRATFGRDYDDLLRQLHTAPGPVDQLRALFALAIDLLTRNYELTGPELSRLLEYRDGDPENASTWSRIAEVATGNNPKA